MESNNLKYILYARKSEEDSKKQILSIESQIEELDNFASSNNLKIVRINKESRSASKEGRPVFNEVMNSIEAGQASALLVWKFDRISRNEFDSARVIKALRLGLLEEIRTPFETFRKNDNILLLYIYFGMADEYSRQLSANVRRGLRAKYRLGEYPNRACLGYRNFERNLVKNIEPDEQYAPIIKKIFEMYASNTYSIANLVDILNNKWKIRNLQGKTFSKSKLQRILINPTYYGCFKRDGELFQGTYEPLISKSLFDKVGEIMHNKGRPRPKKQLHAYKLFIKCSECQSIFTGYTKHKYYQKTNNHAYYTYYTCSKKNGNCSQKPIKENDIENQLIEAITKVKFDQEEWNIAKDLLFLDLDKKRTFEHDLKSRYMKQIDTLNRKLNTILELRTDKEITSEEYLSKKNEFINEKVSYESKIKEVSRFGDEKFELVENFAEVIIQAQNILESDDMQKKRNLVLSLSSNLFIFNRKIEISFKKPFSFYFNEDLESKPSTMWA